MARFRKAHLSCLVISPLSGTWQAHKSFLNLDRLSKHKSALALAQYNNGEFELTPLIFYLQFDFETPSRNQQKTLKYSRKYRHD